MDQPQGVDDGADRGVGLPARRRPRLGLLVIGLVFGAINLPSVGLWAAMGVTLRRFLADPRRRRAFNVVAALTLVATLYPVVAGSR